MVSVLDSIAAFRGALDEVRRRGGRVGLVPTMGYLHDGHVSLVERAARECDAAAVTIFVNPTQFGAGEDYNRYPRDLDRDVELVRRAGASFVFAPGVDEMYPSGTGAGLTTVTVAEVSDGLEGASRPTHFAGVATIVSKLFNIAGPCSAYFGDKDWQQVQVVRQLVRDLDVPVDVVACPTVREFDGLAMSSRNAYLSAEERAAAGVLWRALSAAQGSPDPETVMKEVVAGEPLAVLDYAALVGDRLLIAARVGTTRLIDNVPYRQE